MCVKIFSIIYFGLIDDANIHNIIITIFSVIKIKLPLLNSMK